MDNQATMGQLGQLGPYGVLPQGAIPQGPQQAQPSAQATRRPAADKALRVMARLVRELDTLDAGDQRAAIRWLSERYSSQWSGPAMVQGSVASLMNG